MGWLHAANNPLGIFQYYDTEISLKIYYFSNREIILGGKTALTMAKCIHEIHSERLGLEKQSAE
jgi:hypothetical protein